MLLKIKYFYPAWQSMPVLFFLSSYFHSVNIGTIPCLLQGKKIWDNSHKYQNNYNFNLELQLKSKNVATLKSGAIKKKLNLYF